MAERQIDRDVYSGWISGMRLTSGIEIWWRKDLRSIPKVFLIDAYEVSCRARADKVYPSPFGDSPQLIGSPAPGRYQD
jgi:hypothetical protein